MLSITRCVGEATDLDLRPGVHDKYLYSNAESFFFDRPELVILASRH